LHESSLLKLAQRSGAILLICEARLQGQVNKKTKAAKLRELDKK
jgi:hypothetical protein